MYFRIMFVLCFSVLGDIFLNIPVVFSLCSCSAFVVVPIIFSVRSTVPGEGQAGHDVQGPIVSVLVDVFQYVPVVFQCAQLYQEKDKQGTMYGGL